MTNIALTFASCYICHSTLTSSCIQTALSNYVPIVNSTVIVKNIEEVTINAYT